MSMSRLDRLSELDSILGPEWKIYIDTCSLYRATEDDFWDRLIPVLQKNDCSFIITRATFEEIKRHKHDGRRPDLAEVEQRLEERLLPLGRSGLDMVKTIGDSGDFHDNVIQATIRRRILTHNQVYITNDLGSAWDVYSGIRNSRSVDRDLKDLRIYKIKKNALVDWDQLEYLNELDQIELDQYFELWGERKYSEASNYLKENTSYGRRRSRPNGQMAAAFGRALQKADIEFESAVFAMEVVANRPARLPREGDTLYALCGQDVESIELSEMIARGGEGMVYALAGTEGGRLAKVYRNKLHKSAEKAEQTMKKISYIVNRDIARLPGAMVGTRTGDYVKFPTHVLVNESGEFVGYLMEEARGIPLSKFIADGSVKEVFASTYPTMTKLSLIRICENLLLALEGLYEHDILVGDLNANNILVNTETLEVTLIDADSYQYGDAFPCNVGVEKYTSPEFLERRESNFRTLQNELFVVARLLCEILMMVDNPYNSKIATNPVKDMVEGRFRFTFEFFDGESRLNNSEAPNEELITRWGQLSKALKDGFGNTFHKDGGCWSEGCRLETSYWAESLERYADEIKSSLARADGVVSNEVFPSERRKWVVGFTCKVCGERGFHSPTEFYGIRGLPRDKAPEIAKNYCFGCFCEENGYTNLSCSKCGTEFELYGSPKDGVDFICDLCWLPAKCPECDWDNNGRLKRWMLLDHEGLCKRCFDRKYVRCGKCKKPILRVLARRGSLCGECEEMPLVAQAPKSIPAVNDQERSRGKIDGSATFVKCRRCGSSMSTKVNRPPHWDGLCLRCYNIKKRELEETRYGKEPSTRRFKI